MEAVWFASSSGIQSISEAVSHGVPEKLAREMFRDTSAKRRYRAKKLPAGVIPIILDAEFKDYAHTVERMGVSYDGPYIIATRTSPLTTRMVDWYDGRDVSGYIVNAPKITGDAIEIGECDNFARALLVGDKPCSVAMSKLTMPDLSHETDILNEMTGMEAHERLGRLGYAVDDIPEDFNLNIADVAQRNFEASASSETKIVDVVSAADDVKLDEISFTAAMPAQALPDYTILRNLVPMKVLFTDDSRVDNEFAPTGARIDADDYVPIDRDAIGTDMHMSPDTAYVDEYTSNIVRKLILYSGVIFTGDHTIRVPNDRNLPSLMWEAHEAIVANHSGARDTIVRRYIQPFMKDIETRFADTAEKAYKKIMVVFTTETVPILTSLLATKIHQVILNVLWNSRDSPAYRANMAVTRISGTFNFDSITKSFAITLERILKDSRSWISKPSVMKDLKALKVPEWAMDIEHEIEPPVIPARRAIEESQETPTTAKTVDNHHKSIVRTLTRPKGEGMMTHQAFVRSMGSDWNEFPQTIADAGYPAITSVASIIGSPSAIKAASVVRRDMSPRSIANGLSTLMNMIHESRSDTGKMKALKEAEMNFRIPSRDKIYEAREQKRETRKGIILDQINKADGADRAVLINIRKMDLWNMAGLEEYDMPKNGDNTEHEGEVGDDLD